MKIIIGGPLIDFVKIWLNEFLGFMVFGVKCCDCYVISICCDLYVFWGEWNVRDVDVLNNNVDRTLLCGSPVMIHLSLRVCFCVACRPFM